jgi:CheY-like chemotaxis protein
MGQAEEMAEHKKSILIVEDEMILAMSTKMALEEAGYRVSGISSTREKALSMIEQDRPDMALVDITLGGEVVGMDLAQAIREKIEIPIIYMTGSTDEETLEIARGTKPAGIIKKPADDYKLIYAIKEAIGN